MKEVQKNGTIYYGIFDIVLNKIIFNTKEKINTFIPHTDGAMLALTSTTAYKICAYKNGNDCTDTCSNSEYLLDIEGNTCGSSCPNGKYLFNPSGVCIDQCDQNIYVLDGNTCQLCKDKDKTKPYKLVNGTECLSEIPKEAEYYNEKLKLLKCRAGYHLENNECIQNCYELCKKCTEDSTDEKDQKCTECISSIFNLKNGNCQCPSGSEKKNKNCEECKNSKCATFELNSCNCSSCNESYYLSENTCKECIDSTCATFELNSCNCHSCNESFYLSDNTCKECKKPCSSCENSETQCTGCISGYFLDKNECKDCPTNCKENVTDSCKCKTCNDGFYLDSFYCQNCSSNCKKCDNAQKCNECNIGFYKENYLCNKCDDICETCDGKKVKSN